VTAEHSSSPAHVGIRDRRELPFFQVRLRAVQAIRRETGGPRRLRAIGFYALLCQLANEQRHTGEHRVIRATYDTLAARGQMSKRSIKLLLDALGRSEVVRYERVSDRSTGAIVSLLHLVILDEPWIALTVAMADHLATPRAGGHLLRDLGLVVVLLEFCAEQRAEHGGLAAEVMRGDIAARCGLTVDRVDDCNHALERAGLLHIERRRAANGGRHLASVYTVCEVPIADAQGGVLKPPTRQNGTGRAEDGYRQSGAPVPAARQDGTDRAEGRYRAGGDSATPRTLAPPSSTRAGDGVEETAIEHTPHSLCSAGSHEEGRGEGGSPAERLCEALLDAWVPALGASPRHDYDAHRPQWLTAAQALLARHPRDRLDGALAYMVTDEILSSQALTMTGFAKVADQLIVRAYARQQRTAARRPLTGADGRSWEHARPAIERAIQRHGREGRAAALRELAEHDELLVEFVERVRWSTLCERPLQFAERRYADIWSELTQATQPREERVA
jgi:hypothetical protein